MKKAIAIGIALMVMIIGAMGAAAAKPVIVKNDGVNTIASFTQTVNGITTDTFITGTWGNDGIYVSYNSVSYDEQWNYISSTFGYGPIDPSVGFVSVDRNKLNKAEMFVSTMNVTVQTCDPATYMCTEEPAVLKDIDVRFTGVGPVSKGSYRYTTGDGTFSIRYNDRSAFRYATAIGSVGGESLGSAYYANIGVYKTAQITIQK